MSAKRNNSEDRPDVLLLGSFPFPFGTASSNFIRGHARALVGAGYRVGILAEQEGGREQDRETSSTFSYNGVRYWGVAKPLRRTLAGRLLRNLLAWKDGGLNWIVTNGSLAGVKAVFYYPGVNGTVPLLARLRTLCSRRQVPLYVFAVEWHQVGQFGLSPFSLKAIDGETQRRIINPLTDGVICISSYLRMYYTSKNCRTALIPPLLDLSDPVWASVQSNPIEHTTRTRILFSGSPRRERHDLILKAMVEARKRVPNLTMEYLGPSKAEIATLPGVSEALLSELGDSVLFHGRQSLEASLKIAASSSFGICVRDNAKWSKAGFPSKVPEFLAMGVPMICNLSSDLSDYMLDQQNALVLRNLSVQDLTDVFFRAASMRQIVHQNMRSLARTSARKFSAENFVQTYANFLSPRQKSSQ